MRRMITTLVTAALIALPVAEASASAAKKPLKKKVITKKYSVTGPRVQAERWGPLQVTIVVRKTTTILGTHRTIARRMIGLNTPVYPNHTSRSVLINRKALPILRSEALHFQSYNVNAVSGATFTSEAFVGSLQAAVLKADHL